MRVFIGFGLLLAATACGPALAVDMPQRKPGLWQVSMNMPGRNAPMPEIRMCIDSTTDAEMFKLSMNVAQGQCSRFESRRDGNVVTIDTVCKINERQMTSRSVIRFSGDSAYHTDIDTKFDPPMTGRAESVMTQDAKWTGPCPADLQPGDMMMPTGGKMNIKTILNGK